MQKEEGKDKERRKYSLLINTPVAEIQFRVLALMLWFTAISSCIPKASGSTVAAVLQPID